MLRPGKALSALGTRPRFLGPALNLLPVLSLITLSACSKTQPVVMPCDTDLGYLGEKIHLANVRFLRESRQIDWFELYDNIEERRTMRPSANCIPTPDTPKTERLIEYHEHSIRHLR